MKNILIVTGGSGGHVVPSTSLFEHLKNKFSVKMVTDLRGSKYINTTKFKYELIDVPNLFFKCSNKEVDGTTWPPEPPVTISIFFILI